MEENKMIIQSIKVFLSIVLISVLVFFKEEISGNFPFLLKEYFLVLVFIFSFYISKIFWDESNKNHIMKDRFIDIVTHKFRTPLTEIKWSVDIIETGIDLEARKAEVKKIRISVKKLVEVIDSLAGIIETEEKIFYHFKPINFRTIVETALKETLKKEAEDKGITLSLNFPQKTLIINADDKRMEFVVKNLIDNAIRYTPRGGKIEISAEIKGGTIIFSVKDTGIGIEQKELSNLFTDFYRSKEAKLSDTEGMGLGLYVSRQIVKKHKGRIWATSEGKGKGSQFFVELKMDEYGHVVS